MTRYFCDWCKKEVNKHDDLKGIQLPSFNESVFGNYKIGESTIYNFFHHLCSNCILQVVKFGDRKRAEK